MVRRVPLRIVQEILEVGRQRVVGLVRDRRYRRDGLLRRPVVAVAQFVAFAIGECQQLAHRIVGR